jgi:hypothetical protein
MIGSSFKTADVGIAFQDPTPTSLQPRKYTVHPALLGTDWQGNERG